MQPTFRPDPDKENFSQVYQLEEMLMEEPTFDPKPRKKNRKLTREHELIEKKFRVFDHLVFEEYRGIVDPIRLTAEEPPFWVKCVDRKEGAGGRELEEDYDPRLSRPQTSSAVNTLRQSVSDTSRRNSTLTENRPGTAGTAVGIATKAMRRISLRRSSQDEAKLAAQLQAALRQPGAQPATRNRRTSNPESPRNGGGKWFGLLGRRGSSDAMTGEHQVDVVRPDYYAQNAQAHRNQEFAGGHVRDGSDVDAIASW